MRTIPMLLVICCGLLVGCGGVSAEQRREDAAAARAALEARQEREEHKRQEVTYTTCSTTFQKLQNKLGALNSRLSVGMNFAAYGDAVASARVVYDRTDFGSIDLPAADRLSCLGSVGVPLEKALNQFVAAYSRWNECIGDIYCDVDSIDSELQAHWGKASRSIEKSTSNLDEMQPDPS